MTVRHMAEILRAAGPPLDGEHRNVTVPVPAPPVQLRQANDGIETNRERSSHPLPAPATHVTKQWKIAWFIRALRVEEMDALSEQLFKFERPLNSANDVKDWLLAWAKDEHNVEENPVGT